MAVYDFSTLNSTDLEELVCDLLNAFEKSRNTGVVFKTYKEGKDKGIDFRFSTPLNDNEIIGQVKHFLNSGYDLLLSALKIEKTKADKLTPNRYIFATSVDLSVYNAEEIKNTLNPHIKSLEDIHGKADLNRLLENFPSVLDNHFKLWYSSTDVLRKILNYNIEGRSSEFLEGPLKKRLRLFVDIGLVSKAKEELHINKYIIITGDPAAGKTTLAEMLLYEFIKDDFQLTYIYDDIKEVEKKLINDESKQVFYFDDFLGHTEQEIYKAKGSESALIKILSRFSRLNNKFLILTTRSFLLRSSIEESERFSRIYPQKKECIIDVNNYTSEIRKKILRNHIEESTLADALKQVLEKKNVIEFISSHDNFHPRSIEYITTAQNVNEFSPDEFEKFIYENFEYPSEIWRHAYLYQISEIDRFLLNTMFSFGNSVHIKELEEAFNKRLEYEAMNNNFYKPIDAFRTSFKKLEGGFILQEFEASRDNTKFKFVNSSLIDFLYHYLKENNDEKKRIAEAVLYVNQLTPYLFNLFNTDEVDDIPEGLKSRLINEYWSFIRIGFKNEDRALLALFIYKYLGIQVGDVPINSILREIDSWSFLIDHPQLIYNYVKLLKNLDEQTATYVFVIEHGMRLFAHILFDTSSIHDAFFIIDLMRNKYLIQPNELLFEDIEFDLEEHLNDLLQEEIWREVESLLETTTSANEADEKLAELTDIRNELRVFGFNIDGDFSDFQAHDWDEVAQHNLFEYFMSKDD